MNFCKPYTDNNLHLKLTSFLEFSIQCLPTYRLQLYRPIDIHMMILSKITEKQIHQKGSQKNKVFNKNRYLIKINQPEKESFKIVATYFFTETIPKKD